MAEELKPMDDAEFYEEFTKWWEEDGQYVRAGGGGNYERAFAFQAFRHLMPQIAALRAQLPSQQGAGEAVVVVAFLMRPDIFGPYVSLSRDSNCSGAVDQLMTVAQHLRIMAAATRPADPDAMAVQRWELQGFASELARITHDARTPNETSQELASLLIAVRALLAGEEGVKKLELMRELAQWRAPSP